MKHNVSEFEGLPSKLASKLTRLGFSSKDQLRAASELDIIKLPGIGRGSVHEIRTWLGFYENLWHEGLSVRASNCLMKGGAKSKEDARRIFEYGEINKIPDLGKITRNEISAWLGLPSISDVRIDRHKTRV